MRALRAPRGPERAAAGCAGEPEGPGCDDGAAGGAGASDRTGGAGIDEVFRIIYRSQPFGYDASILGGILLDARRCNARDGITGALICRRDVYLQLLEGPGAAVAAAYARIKRDDRHLDVTAIVSAPAPARMFPDWAMLHDPARSWLWSEPEVAAGRLDGATRAEIEAVFARLTDAPPDPSPDDGPASGAGAARA